MLPEGGEGVAGEGGVTNVPVPPASDCVGPCTAPIANFRPLALHRRKSRQPSQEIWGT